MSLFDWSITLVTYVNRSLQPFKQEYNPASQPNHAVCVNFNYQWWDLQLTVDYER